ncbi:MAG: hypothetical protein JJU02_12560 [Cryomorphaceae bacterium]|nr:hypothetical protein [Cryomorphaceae bacterium]
MKTITRINLFAISLPVVLLLGFLIFGGSVVIFAMWSTMLTGAIQVILSLILALKTKGNRQILRYISFVAIYFVMLYTESVLGAFPFTKTAVFNQVFFGLSVTIPVVLAIYLTMIIYDLEGGKMTQKQKP